MDPLFAGEFFRRLVENHYLLPAILPDGNQVDTLADHLEASSFNQRLGVMYQTIHSWACGGEGVLEGRINAYNEQLPVGTDDVPLQPFMDYYERVSGTPACPDMSQGQDPGGATPLPAPRP